MNLIDRLGKWYYYFDKHEFNYILKTLRHLYSTEKIMPDSHNIFKAFELCDIEKNHVVIIGQDVYPQKNIATGIAFANRSDTKQDNWSPSLKKLLEPLNVYELFDCSLLNWCNQGVLLLNSALTCVMGKPNSHSLLWRSFITAFLNNYSSKNKDVVYVLLGTNAKSCKDYILKSLNIIELNHPSYFCRYDIPMPDFYYEVNKTLKINDFEIIDWYA